MTNVLTLPDDNARADLVTFLKRALQFSDQGVRFRSHAGLALVSVPVTASSGLMDVGSTILGMRVMRLSTEAEFDSVVTVAASISALEDGADLELSSGVNVPAWAAISPPRSGWEHVGDVDVQTVKAAAETTHSEVTRLLPDSAGEAIVRRVRREVWADPVHAMPDLTRGSAVALDGLGFLARGPVRVTASGPWVRASTPLGDVLEKRAL